MIEPDGLETIEILRGPSSAQYGSDALGGSVQFFSKPPALGVSDQPRWRGTVNVSGGTGYRYGSGSGVIGYAAPSLGVTGVVSGRRAGLIRAGGGIDSHAAVTRFLGLSSDVLMDARLPDTGFWQIGGAGRANWKIDSRTNLVTSYMRTVQDDGDRYDQLLGGDGNLISELNDLSLDLLSLRLERLGLGPFDHASFSYSLNSQREERVNQGGNGNPAATIGHEPERMPLDSGRYGVRIIEPICDAMGIPHHLVSQDSDLAKIGPAIDKAYADSFPVALLIGRRPS